MNLSMSKPLFNLASRARRRWVMGAVALGVALAAAVSPTVFADPAARQDVDAFDLASFTDVGEAWLVRTDDGITASITVDDAEPGVYTMWWILVNYPENCFLGPYVCSDFDYFNPYVGGAIGHAGGVVVNENGRLTISADLDEGETLTGFPVAEYQSIGFQITETTLVDSRHAAIRLVLRWHGEKVPGLVGTALQTLQGACEYEAPFLGTEPTYGIPGPNECIDRYAAEFQSEDAP